MRIAYDHQIFSLQPYGGISRYFVELASHLAVDADVAASVVAPMHLNHLLRGNRTVPVHGVYVPHLRGTGALRFRSNSAISRAYFHGIKTDLVHETYFTGERTAAARTPTVLTVFDMIHERFPDSFPPGDPTHSLKRAAIHRAARVICISESTRRDLLRYVTIDPDLVSVIPLAADPGLVAVAAATRSVAAPYVLYVGERSGYKNFSACVAAFAETGLAARGVAFVCFGGGDWTRADEQAVRQAGLPATSVIHARGGDDVLATLYRHAELFVYPSLYEGFGIPPLEAMICGCPVACSGTASLPEVVGPAAETFNPGDVVDIARALLRVVDSPSRGADLRRLGTRRAAEFSWQRCAEQTKIVYQSSL